MEVSEIIRDRDREFMTQMFEALETDRSEGDFRLGLGYKVGHGEYAGFFVRPRFVVRDVSRGLVRGHSALEIGDEVLQETKSFMGHSKIGFVLQRLGIPRTQPSNLGRLESFDKDYFLEGSGARQVLEDRGYGFAFEEFPEIIVIDHGYRKANKE
jgi:hypothetical protein